MTTYKLPPEPEVGAKVHPADYPDVVWTCMVDGMWGSPGRGRHTWAGLLGEYDPQPLTLIEPDPWPTAPLIVADRTDGDGIVRRLWLLYRHPNTEDDTLTNVVPVTVVPTAEWEALVEKVRSFDAARTDNQWRVVTARAAELLVAATDALGLDQ